MMAMTPFDVSVEAPPETARILEPMTARMRGLIEENPVAALAVALLGGLVVGWVLKRH